MPLPAHPSNHPVLSISVAAVRRSARPAPQTQAHADKVSHTIDRLSELRSLAPIDCEVGIYTSAKYVPFLVSRSAPSVPSEFYALPHCHLSTLSPAPHGHGFCTPLLFLLRME